MENQFEQELKESLYIHRPLPLHRERGLESKFPRKRVLARHPLQGVPKADGTALLEECPGLLRMTASLRSDHCRRAPPATGITAISVRRGWFFLLTGRIGGTTTACGSG